MLAKQRKTSTRGNLDLSSNTARFDEPTSVNTIPLFDAWIWRAKRLLVVVLFQGLLQSLNGYT